MEDHKDTTIRDARTYLNSQLERGKAAKCPCCTQTVKVYKRRIYSQPAKSLINLYRLNKTAPNYYHISEVEPDRKSGGGDFAKLAYWGLIEEMPKDAARTNQRTSGFWKITELGKAFVEDRLKVAQYIEVYNGKPLRMGGDKVGIKDTLGKDFDYGELMQG